MDKITFNGQLKYDEKQRRVSFPLPTNKINSHFFNSLKRMEKFNSFSRLEHIDNVCSFYSNRPIPLSQVWEESNLDKQYIIRLIECLLFQMESLRYFQVYLYSISMEDVYCFSNSFVFLNPKKIIYEKNSILNKLSSPFDSPEVKTMSIPGRIPKDAASYSLGLIVYTLFFNQCPYWEKETKSYIDPKTLLSVEKIVETMPNSHFSFFLKRCFTTKELCFL